MREEFRSVSASQAHLESSACALNSRGQASICRSMRRRCRRSRPSLLPSPPCSMWMPRCAELYCHHCLASCLTCGVKEESFLEALMLQATLVMLPCWAASIFVVTACMKHSMHVRPLRGRESSVLKACGQRGAHHGPHAHFSDAGSLNTCLHQRGGRRIECILSS